MLKKKERMEPEAVGKIMDQLLPQLPAPVVTPREDEEGPPLLTAEEIDAAVDQVRAKAKKAPGPDEIPNSVWTIIHQANPGILNVVFNLALKSGVFPSRWKMAWLVLLQKPGKPVGDPASFWPLCMLDTVGKIFEQVIAKWLRKHFQGKRALSADQYGLRAGCSTIDVARRLKKLTAAAIKERQFGAAVSLDIQNTFNSMP